MRPGPRACIVPIPEPPRAQRAGVSLSRPGSRSMVLCCAGPPFNKTLLTTFVSPMTPYFLADVYFGFEPAARCGLPAVRARPLFAASGHQRRAWCGVAGRSNATRITEPQIAAAAAAAAQLPAYTKLYVQVSVFASFVQRLLPRI